MQASVIENEADDRWRSIERRFDTFSENIADLTSRARGATANPSANSIPTGTVIAFAGTVTPTGWLLCDGSVLNPATNPELKSLSDVLGDQYGAVNRLPNLIGRVVYGRDPSSSVIYSGSNSATLTVANLPRIDVTTSTNGSHTHGVRCEFGTDRHLRDSPGGQYNQINGNRVYPFLGSDVIEATGNHNHTISIPGQSIPISITPPNAALRYIIKI